MDPLSKAVEEGVIDTHTSKSATRKSKGGKKTWGAYKGYTGKWGPASKAVSIDPMTGERKLIDTSENWKVRKQIKDDFL